MGENEMTVSEMLRLACYYAEESQRDFLAAYAKCDSPEDEALKQKTREFIEKVRAYRLKRWGKTRKEQLMDDAESISITEFLRRKVGKPAGS